MKRLLITVVALGFVAPAVAQNAKPAPVTSQTQKTQPVKPLAPKADQKKTDGKSTIKDKANTGKDAKPAGNLKPAQKDGSKSVPKQQVK